MCFSGSGSGSGSGLGSGSGVAYTGVETLYSVRGTGFYTGSLELYTSEGIRAGAARPVYWAIECL